MKHEKKHEVDESKEGKKEHHHKGAKKDNNKFIAGVVIAVILIIIVILTTAKTKNDTIATVNGEKITQTDLDLQFARLTPQQQAMIGQDMLLNQTVAELLLIQEAKKHGITVAGSEIDDLINSFKEQSGITDERFEELLKNQNMTLKTAKEVYTKQLYVAKEINQSILKKVSLNANESKEFYAANKDMFDAQEQRRVAHILILVNEERSDAGAKKLSEKIKGEITSFNFADLAKKYSEDPGSKDNGGEYTFEKGKMVKEFEDAAFSMNVGEIRIVKTQYGYHIMKLLEKISAGIIPFSKVQGDIEKMLLSQKQQDALQKYVESLFSTAKIEILKSLSSEKESDPSDAGVIQNVAADSSSDEAKPNEDGNTNNPGTISTFEDTGDEICSKDGLPVVMVYSTTWCPHCQWISSTVDSVLSEYAKDKKIVAYHYELDTGDDILTPETEKAVPQADLDIYEKYNPQGSIPTFVFGCKYSRIGNGYEAKQDLASEDAEFRAVIEELIQ